MRRKTVIGDGIFCNGDDILFVWAWVSLQVAVKDCRGVWRRTYLPHVFMCSEILMFLFPEKTLCEQKSSHLFINNRSKLAPAYSEPWMNHRKFGACPVFTFDFMFRSSLPFLKINPLSSFPPEVSFSVFSCWLLWKPCLLLIRPLCC